MKKYEIFLIAIALILVISPIFAWDYLPLFSDEFNDDDLNYTKFYNYSLMTTGGVAMKVIEEGSATGDGYVNITVIDNSATPATRVHLKSLLDMNVTPYDYIINFTWGCDVNPNGACVIMISNINNETADWGPCIAHPTYSRQLYKTTADLIGKNNWSIYINYTGDDARIYNGTGLVGRENISAIYGWYLDFMSCSYGSAPTSLFVYNLSFNWFSTLNLDISTSLTRPLDNEYIFSNYGFEASHSATFAEVANTTLYIWHKDSSIFKTNFTKLSGGTANSNLSISGFDFEEYTWGHYACANKTDGTSICKVSNNRTFFYGYRNNSVTFNSSSYETITEPFILNITTNGTPPTSAYLLYNGTLYDASIQNTAGNDYNIYKNFRPPIGTANNFSFIYNLGTKTIITQNYSQTILPIHFAICNSSLNIPYLNITFKDEVSLGVINSNISGEFTYSLENNPLINNYTYTNLIGKPSYAFCFSPTNRIFYTDLTAAYSSTGYPQRTFLYTGALTNITLNQTLYLLSSSDGIYSTIITLSTANTPISSVNLLIERQISGEWITIGEQLTDSAGAATFWVNPNAPHRVTASKTGYATTIVTITPTQSQYTMTLSSTAGNASYSNIFEGINYKSSPKEGFINTNTTYSFWLNITSSLCNLNAYKIELSLANGTILNYTEGTSACGSNISTDLNTLDYNKIFASYYVDIGTGYYRLDPLIYIPYNITAGEGSIYIAIQNILNQRVDIKEQYGQLWWFFFFLFVGLSAFCFFTGAELSQPGIVLPLVFLIVLIFSIMGFFNMEFSSSNPYFNQYSLLIVTLFLTGGELFRRMRT